MAFKNKLALLCSVSLIISGCMWENEQPKERPSGTASGVAFDNLLKNADVIAYSLSGDVLGTGKTDTAGVYSIELTGVPTQPIKLVAKNGQYTEEYSNQSVNLVEGDKLIALVNYTNGQNIDTSLTYLTSLAAGYAEYLARAGMDYKKAIKTANNSISEWVDFNISSTVPLDILDVRNASPSLNEGLKYSFVTSAISALTAKISETNGVAVHEYYNSIGFASLAYEDIKADGALNGVGSNGRLSMGIVEITPEFYRHKHALNMFAIANSPHNRTSISATDVFTLAKKINDKAGEFFGNEPVIDLSASKPIIEIIGLADNEIISGDYSLRYSVFDNAGVQSAKIIVGNKEFAITDLAKGSYLINLLSFPDGQTAITLEVKSFSGGISKATKQVNIKNNGINISNLYPAQNQYVKGIVNFSAKIEDSSGIKSQKFLIGGVQYMPTAGQNATHLYNTTSVADGSYKFRVEAVNQLDIFAFKETSFFIDNTKPTISTSLTDGIYFDSVDSFTLSGTDSAALKHLKYYVNGQQQAIYDSTINYGMDINVTPNFHPDDFGEGIHTAFFQAVDKAGNIAEITRKILVDKTPPSVTISSPSGHVYLDSDINLKYEVSDNVGFGNKKLNITLDGISIAKTLPDSTNYIIGKDLISEGQHIVSVIAADGNNNVTTIPYAFTMHKLPIVTSKALRFLNHEHDAVGLATRSSGQVFIRIKNAIFDEIVFPTLSFNGSVSRISANEFKVIVIEPQCSSYRGNGNYSITAKDSVTNKNFVVSFNMNPDLANPEWCEDE